VKTRMTTPVRRPIRAGRIERVGDGTLRHLDRRLDRADDPKGVSVRERPGTAVLVVAATGLNVAGKRGECVRLGVRAVVVLAALHQIMHVPDMARGAASNPPEGAGDSELPNRLATKTAPVVLNPVT